MGLHVAELLDYSCSFVNSCPVILLCVSKAQDIAAEVSKVFNVLSLMYIDWWVMLVLPSSHVHGLLMADSKTNTPSMLMEISYLWECIVEWFISARPSANSKLVSPPDRGPQSRSHNSTLSHASHNVKALWNATVGFDSASGVKVQGPENVHILGWHTYSCHIGSQWMLSKKTSWYQCNLITRNVWSTCHYEMRFRRAKIWSEQDLLFWNPACSSLRMLPTSGLRCWRITLQNTLQGLNSRVWFTTTCYIHGGFLSWVAPQWPHVSTQQEHWNCHIKINR